MLGTGDYACSAVECDFHIYYYLLNVPKNPIRYPLEALSLIIHKSFLSFLQLSCSYRLFLLNEVILYIFYSWYIDAAVDKV